MTRTLRPSAQRPSRPIWSEPATALDLAVIAAVFAATQVPAPLFTSSQNTYFLHGAAAAGYGDLHADWLATTADPFPLFSTLVFLVLRAGVPQLFTAAYFFLNAAYAWALVGVGAYAAGLRRSRLGTYALGAVLVAVHTVLDERPDAPWRFSLHEALTSGVAGQFALGSFLGPSSFGVLLIVAVYFAVRGRPIASVAAACAAAWVHASYLLPAATLTLALMAAMAEEGKRPRRVVAVALFALVLALPAVGYAALTFGSGPLGALEAAQRVLVTERIPHHAVPAVWFDDEALFLLVASVVALWAVRREPRLRWALALLLIVGVAGTLAQVASGSHRLALLFPWRTSVVVAPLVTAVLAALALRALAGQLLGGLSVPARQATGAVAVGVLLLGAGAALSDAVPRYVIHLADPIRPRTDVEAFVARTRASGDEYLVPVGWGDFRFSSGAPTYVDWKSHPYRDVEVLEWRRRVGSARTAFAADTAAACDELGRLRSEGGVTHVVAPEGAALRACPGLEEEFAGSKAVVYGVQDLP